MTYQKLQIKGETHKVDYIKPIISWYLTHSYVTRILKPGQLLIEIWNALVSKITNTSRVGNGIFGLERIFDSPIIQP